MVLLWWFAYILDHFQTFGLSAYPSGVPRSKQSNRRCLLFVFLFIQANVYVCIVKAFHSLAQDYFTNSLQHHISVCSLWWSVWILLSTPNARQLLKPHQNIREYFLPFLQISLHHHSHEKSRGSCHQEAPWNSVEWVKTQ